MKNLPNIAPWAASVAVLAFSASSAQAVWITNFTTEPSSTTATGVWREVTVANTGAGTDSGFVVNLTTTGLIKPTTDPTQPSRIDESFPWRDFLGPSPFAAGVNGDFINIETDGGSTSTVTFNLGAQVTDPMLSFSDIDVDTVLTFTDSFTVADSTTNLASTATTVSNNGTDAGPPFDEEAAGSLQFTGTFTQLQFTITNNASPGTEDRTGFVITSANAPVPEPATSAMLVLGSLVFLNRRRK